MPELLHWMGGANEIGSGSVRGRQEKAEEVTHMNAAAKEQGRFQD